MAMPSKRTDLKVVGGSDRPDRRRAKTKTKRLSRCPSPPSRLGPLARAEWRKLAPKAHKLGTLTDTDLRGFELLCETLAVETGARAILADEGWTVTAGSGGEKSHPAIAVMNSARSAAHRMLCDFGLTPRGRMSVDAAPEEDDPSKDSFFA